MSMSTQDYNLISNVIADQILSNPLTSPAHHERRAETVRIANKLSHAFEKNNPRFRPELFISKCCLTGKD